jgi:hypothetical protein
MISDATGLRLKVIGRSIAKVATGPIPGSTPMAVPIRVPIRQKKRFAGENATLNPSQRLSTSSMDHLAWKDAHGDPEQLHEQQS